jgi:Uma2 family endonuclease
MSPQDIAPHLPHLLTKADFDAFLSNDPEGRFEFEHGRIIDMTGGTLNHSGIGSRFVFALMSQLDDDNWQVHGTDRGVETATTVRYPDALVIAHGEPSNSRWTRAPVLIVEVLSPSSEVRDLGTKRAEYLSFPSLEAYIVALPDEPTCHVWLRNAKRRFPKKPSVCTGPLGVISVPALGLTLALGDIYKQLLRPKKKPV